MNSIKDTKDVLNKTPHAFTYTYLKENHLQRIRFNNSYTKEDKD